MTSKVRIVLCEPEAQHEWDHYVQSSPQATIGHHFLWQSIIHRAYGHQPLYLMAQRDSRVCGVLPLFLVHSRLFGKSLTSMPFLDYGGICADDEMVAHLLLETALHLRQEYGADQVELRQCVPPTGKGALRLDKVSMRLDLSPGVEALWRSFPAKVRNQVRRAEKSGLCVHFGGVELLEEFYAVFAVNMRDLGSPVHHQTFFARMFAEFGPHIKLVLVREGQRPVGGLVSLFFKDTVTVPWASSLRQDLSKCPNNLLYWGAIREVCAQGYTCFDFGRSSLGSGTYTFKQQWGTKPTQIYWQVLTRNGKPGMAFAATESKYQAILELWKRLPVPLTTWLGPRIRKYLTN